MKRRLIIFVLAPMLPVLVAVGVIYYGLPPDTAGASLAPPSQNTTVILPPVAAPRIIPETLVEAQEMAKARLAEINQMTEDEWQKERQKILHKFPPETRALAIERAERRVNDLAAMNEVHWKVEREKLLARVQANP